MPRQMPRYGISCSRATRQARIFPSHPREPNPPGTSTPSACSSSWTASSYVMFSASTQRTWTRQPAWTPACLSASWTERYASWSFTYLPTSAISTSSRSSRVRSIELGPLAELGGRRLEPELLADERVEPLGLEHLRHEVDVGHVRATRSRRGGRRRRRARSSRGCRRRAARSSGRRRCRGGYRSGAARSPSAASASSSARRPHR